MINVVLFNMDVAPGKRLHFYRASLFIFGRSYFVMALVVNLNDLSCTRKAESGTHSVRLQGCSTAFAKKCTKALVAAFFGEASRAQ